MRADAKRNRDRLLEVATRAFAAGGSDASLEGIARAAGVGIGTLYRHFPTREALVEAAYRNELERLCSAAPDVGLREWMDLFVDYMTTKHGMTDALRAVIASGGNPYEHSRTRLLEAITHFIDAGELRPDVRAEDFLTALSGITLAAQPGQAGRLLDLLMNGTSRPAGPPGGS